MVLLGLRSFKGTYPASCLTHSKCTLSLCSTQHNGLFLIHHHLRRTTHIHGLMYDHTHTCMATCSITHPLFDRTHSTFGPCSVAHFSTFGPCLIAHSTQGVLFDRTHHLRSLVRSNIVPPWTNMVQGIPFLTSFKPKCFFSTSWT